MKSRNLVFAGLTLSLLAILLAGCDLGGMTIESRIDSFVSDLNIDRAGAIGNFHPVETAYYGAISGAPSFWDTDFTVGDGTDYYVVAVDSTDSLAVQVTIDGPPTFAGPTDFKFVMYKDGMTWYVEELWYWGASNIVQ